MEFTEWLQNELDKRGWSQNELVRRSQEFENRISQTQLSNILLGKRHAGPDSCIAIAQTLGLPRETVFRARGWLLREPEDVFPPGAEPILLELDQLARTWTPTLRQTFLQSVKGLATAIVLAEHGKKPTPTGFLLGGIPGHG